MLPYMYYQNAQEEKISLQALRNYLQQKRVKSAIQKGAKHFVTLRPRSRTLVARVDLIHPGLCNKVPPGTKMSPHGLTVRNIMGISGVSHPRKAATCLSMQFSESEGS